MSQDGYLLQSFLFHCIILSCSNVVRRIGKKRERGIVKEPVVTGCYGGCSRYSEASKRANYFETINKETPEMKQLISGIREVSKRLREIAQTHRPLFGGEIYLTGREVCERLFVSPRTLQDYRDKGIIPYTQIAGKIFYRLSDINRLLQENYHSAL